MKSQLVSFAGRLCLAILALCIVFHLTYLGMAYAVEQLTEPPKCQVAYSFPLPFAACPGFGLSANADYALALPGAILAFPFVLPGLLSDANSGLQLFVLAPAALHIVGWGYLFLTLTRRLFGMGSV